MKSVLFYIILFFSSGFCYPQDSVAEKKTASHELMGYVYACPGYEISRINNNEVVVIRTKDSLNHFINSGEIGCRSMEPIDPMPPADFDFSKRSIILISYSGIDCHSTFEFDWKKENETEFTITVTVKYGGCRAGGFHYLQLVSVPALPENAKISQKVVILD
ncbi:MAG: hypothetical protein ACOZCO_12860 [Bacteroidota bacterium]